MSFSDERNFFMADLVREVREARLNLELQRRKIKQLRADQKQIQKQLEREESLEAELDRTLKTCEEGLKPPILLFTEKLQESSGVEAEIVEEAIAHVEDMEEIFSVVRNRALNISEMSRSQLLGFIKTILNLRDSFLENDIQTGVQFVEVKDSSKRI